MRRAERAYPGLSKAVGSLRVRRVEHAVPQFGVGHYRGIERLRREQLARFDKRRLLLCGDYLVAPHPEGAVRSGLRAAEELWPRLA